jgi:hypothetical protein
MTFIVSWRGKANTMYFPNKRYFGEKGKIEQIWDNQRMCNFQMKLG